MHLFGIVFRFWWLLLYLYRLIWESRLSEGAPEKKDFGTINVLAILRDLFGVVNWPKQRSGMKGSRIELPGSCFSCSISWDTYWKFTIELGLGWTWQIDCEALPTGRGNSSTGLVPTLYQAGNNWAVRIGFAAFMQQPGWPHFPYRMVRAKDRNNLRVDIFSGN